MRGVVVNKVVCVVAGDAVDVGNLVAELDAVELGRVLEELRSGRRRIMSVRIPSAIFLHSGRLA